MRPERFSKSAHFPCALCSTPHFLSAGGSRITTTWACTSPNGWQRCGDHRKLIETQVWRRAPPPPAPLPVEKIQVTSSLAMFEEWLLDQTQKRIAPSLLLSQNPAKRNFQRFSRLRR